MSQLEKGFRHDHPARGSILFNVGLLILILILAIPIQDATALLAERILANVDLTAIRSETGDLRNETLRQQYNASWSRQLLPYVTLSSSFRYFRFELAEEEVASIWQKEMLPRLDLAWKHPQFHLSAGLSRRDSWSLSGKGALRTDALNLALRTRNPHYPLASLIIDWQHSIESGQERYRDTMNRRLQAGLSYTRWGGTLGYTLTRRLSENLLPGLRAEQLDQRLSWSGSLQSQGAGRVRLSTQYTFNHSVRTDRAGDGVDVIEQLTIIVPLYAEDHAPDFGALDALTGLADGEKAVPVDPPVDIGGSREYQNLGADLGFVRPISDIFIYTDRASGAGLVWDVYSSDDNLDWTRRVSGATSRFNVVLNRYEIEFNSFESRYIKAVNIGLNEVVEVLVTEIEVYKSIPTRDRSVTRDSQLGNISLGVHLTERLSAAVDMSFQYEPATGLVESRMNSGYRLSGRFDQTVWLSHHLRWEQALQDFETTGGDILDNIVTYSMLLNPLETLGASFTALHRQNWYNRDLDQEVSSAGLDFHGKPGWGLDLAVNLLRNQTVLHREGREYGTWSFRTSLGGALTKNLDFRSSYAIQDTRNSSGEHLSRRHLWGIEYSYRLTGTLNSSGRFNYVTDADNYRSQNYNLTWRPLPSLSLSGAADLADSDAGLNTCRYSIGASYDIHRRSAFYLRFAVTDLSEAGGSRTTTFQQGFRSRF